jgi:hypothetical protein
MLICLICSGNKYIYYNPNQICILNCPDQMYPDNITYQCYTCQVPC